MTKTTKLNNVNVILKYTINYRNTYPMFVFKVFNNDKQIISLCNNY